ncbi:putative F-box protein At3g28280 [Durio zibethinus]|uniref:F-box protein At3g28280 n=1 Tax=Durio zibethinus TaxID=66656 RepID=A0A6P6BEQ3_DURZI|nr:putative F-box protein At3g28280 [Durio zibethinus]
MNPCESSNTDGWYDESPLPECLVIEILVRLPVKYVFGFKCISRQWLSIISDPGFARFYISHESSGSTTAWTLLRNLNCKYEEIIMNYAGFSDSKSMALPPAPTIFSIFDIHKQSKQNRHLIFATKVEGVIATGYKVVQLIIPRGGTAFLDLEIFSSETGEWTSTQVHCSQGVLIKRARFKPIALNGILYIYDDNNPLLRYDLDSKDDRCQCIPMPNRKWNPVSFYTIHNINQDDLRYFYINETELHKNLSLELWVLNSGE